jgi:hypothetical protein
MAPQTQDQIDLSDGLVAKPGMDLSDGLVAKDSASSAPAPEMGIRDSIEAAINDPGNVPDTGWAVKSRSSARALRRGLLSRSFTRLKLWDQWPKQCQLVRYTTWLPVALTPPKRWVVIWLRA